VDHDWAREKKSVFAVTGLLAKIQQSPVADPVRIVALTDDPSLGDAVKREVGNGEVTLAPDLASARRALGHGPAVLVLADEGRLAAASALLDEAVPGTPIVLLDPSPDRPEMLAAI
jgi:hypothetical protein